MEVLEENESESRTEKPFICWELPEEIQAIYRVNTQNNNQNQNTKWIAVLKLQHNTVPRCNVSSSYG